MLFSFFFITASLSLHYYILVTAWLAYESIKPACRPHVPLKALDPLLALSQLYSFDSAILFYTFALRSVFAHTH